MMVEYQRLTLIENRQPMQMVRSALISRRVLAALRGRLLVGWRGRMVIEVPVDGRRLVVAAVSEWSQIVT